MGRPSRGVGLVVGWVVGLVVAAGLSGCGAGTSLFKDGLSIPDLCQEKDALLVHGAGAGGPQELDAPVDLAVKDQASAWLGGVHGKSELHLSSVTLTAASGVQDFSFIDALTFDVDGADPSAPRVRVLDYRKSASSGASNTLVLEPAQDVDLLSLLQNGDLKGGLQVTGALPAATWTFNAKACFLAKVLFSQ